MGETNGEEVSPWPLDARGLPCPVPIAMLARALKEHAAVELLADDPAARADVEAFCQQTGFELRSLSEKGSLITAVVRRRG